VKQSKNNFGKIRDFFISQIKYTMRYVAVWILIGLIALAIYVCKFRQFTWEALSGFATWVLVAGVGIAIWQLFESKGAAEKQDIASRKGVYTQIALDIYNELHSKEVTEKIKNIYRMSSLGVIELHQKELEGTYKIDDIDEIIQKFDFVGGLIRYHIIAIKLVLDSSVGIDALKIWDKLEPYIRKKQNDDRYYAVNYEGLVRFTLDYYLGKKRIELPFHSKMYDLVFNMNRDDENSSGNQKLRRYIPVTNEQNDAFKNNNIPS
jgi:hypothetical protein